MISNYKIKVVLFLFVFFSVIFSGYSNVEVFSNYDTNLTITSNETIEINKSLSLKNVYESGIVPGQIEFKIARGGEGSVGNIDVGEVKAYDSYGQEINSEVRKTQNYSVIILDVFYPLLPDFEYDFNLFYTLSYDSSGIFFKNLKIPIRESTIPIEQGSFNVEVPENYHFTYLDSNDETVATVNNSVASWAIEDDSPSSIEFEYSYLPFRVGSLQGSYVFWIFINFLILLFLIFEVRKEVKRIRNQ